MLNSAINIASSINKPITILGEAPMALHIAISLLLSFKLENIIAAIPTSVVNITTMDIPSSKFSTTPTTRHSSCNAAPGKIAVIASSGYSFTQRWRLKMESLDLPILITDKNKHNQYLGRSPYNQSVYINEKNSAVKKNYEKLIGSMLNVKIIKSNQNSLLGVF